MQTDSRTAIHSESLLTEANGSINNLKHWRGHSEPIAPLCTQNKMNGTAYEAKQKPFQYMMKKIPGLLQMQGTIVILWYIVTFLHCRLQKNTSIMLAELFFFFTFTIIIIMDRFIWGKKWSFRKTLGDCSRAQGMGADVHYKAICSIMRKAFFPILLIVGTT